MLSDIPKTILLLGVPLVWWFAATKGNVSFFEYVGLKKVRVTHELFATTIILTIVFVKIIMPSLYYRLIPELFAQSSSLDSPGIWVLAYVILVHPIFLTGFLEEVAFRGFLGKRLIAKFGFAVGNTMQAAIFGLGHNVPGLSLTSAVSLVIITGTFGWIAGYITEKQAGGSITPAWILHAFANSPFFIMRL